jgi:hypothetical protein
VQLETRYLFGILKDEDGNWVDHIVSSSEFDDATTFLADLNDAISAAKKKMA